MDALDKQMLNEIFEQCDGAFTAAPARSLRQGEERARNTFCAPMGPFRADA
jgi:hypothetical protein